MIYVFPVSKSDAHLIDPLCDVIAYLGGMKGRQTIVVSDPQSSKEAGYLNDRLIKLDAKSQLHTFPQNFQQGWPVACNYYFLYTVGYLTNTLKIASPFYYFELDNTPVKAGWMERIGSEWGTAVSQGKSFLGVLRDYYAKDAQGNLTVHGSIMNGSGVYPPNFGRVSPLLRSVAKSPLPWDVYMRWEICGPTRKPNVHDISQWVAFNWATENYRMENGEIACDVRKRPEGIITSDKVYPITQDTVLVHGCKDGSLAKLIMGKSIEKVTTAPLVKQDKPKEEPLHGIKPMAPAPASEVRSLIKELLDAGEDVPDEFKPKTAPIPAPTVAPVIRHRGRRAKRTRQISPEERQRRSERMKAVQAEKKAQKLLAVA